MADSKIFKLIDGVTVVNCPNLYGQYKKGPMVK